MHTSLRLLVGARFLFLAIAQDNTVSLAPAPRPTPGSSAVIAPSFAGFGIEPSNLFSFTGGSSPNELSINLISNLANYTGTPPHFRIGGNTADNMLYRPDYNEWEVGLNPDPKGSGGWYPTDYFLFGPKFFEALDRFPKDTPITYGLNLADHIDGYMGRIVQTAEAAFTQIKNLRLVSYEIGNEPDLYVEANYRNSTWDGAQYVQQWLARANAIWGTVLQPNNVRVNFFEPGCTASTIGTSFTVDDLIQDGVTKKINGTGTYVASFNQHDYYYYIGVSDYPLTIADFMDLSTTNAQFRYWVSEVQSAHNAGFPYALREMGVVGPIGMDGITNVFGASLWTLNFFFYVATLNISSVQMHMTDNSNASAWQPINYYGDEPYVRPNYYAWAAFDQTIGPTCQARVSGYIIQDAPERYQGHIGAYSVYQDDELASIVIINTAIVNASTADKPSLTVDLTLPTQFAGEWLYLSYLSNDGADSKFGTTWNGISYELSRNGQPTVVADNVGKVKIGDNGTVQVSVRDTQAVVANIGSQVGSRTHKPEECSRLAAATTPMIVGLGEKSGTGDNLSAGNGACGLGPRDVRILMAGTGLLITAILWGFALI